MSDFTEARMHLGVEISGAGHHPGAASFLGVPGAADLLPMVRSAASQGLDHVVLPATVDLGAGPVPHDAVAAAAGVAPLVDAIGLIPTVPVAADGAVAAPLAELDHASAGRSGWEPVGTDWSAIDRAVAAVAEVPRVGAGGTRAPVVLRADTPESLPVVARWADVVRISAPGFSHRDGGLAATLDAARAARQRVRAAIAAAGRDADAVPVLLDVEVHLADDRHRAAADVVAMDAAVGRGTPPTPATVRVLGTTSTLAGFVERALRARAADGLTFLPLVLPEDLRRITHDLVPLLAGRGLYRGGRPGGLRTRLGLAPAAVARRASA